MALEAREQISAQVVLHPEPGRPRNNQQAITAANIAEFAPSANSVARVTRAFAEAGFTVGPMVGNSFSITGPASLFETVFQTALERHEKGGLQARRADGSRSRELPPPRLPGEVADLISAVALPRPPDFGPTDYR